MASMANSTLIGTRTAGDAYNPFEFLAVDDAVHERVQSLEARAAGHVDAQGLNELIEVAAPSPTACRPRSKRPGRPWTTAVGGRQQILRPSMN